MARRISRSQFNSKMRQAMNKAKQQARKFDRENKRAIDKFNRDVRKFNAAQRTRQRKIQTALNQLSRQPVVQTYSIVFDSTRSLGQAYENLEAHAPEFLTEEQHRLIIDLPQQETANSLDVIAALTGDGPLHLPDGVELGTTAIEEELKIFSADLDDRWRGAIYALNPGNPDASRHFCSSTREIIIEMIDSSASNSEVILANPNCDLHQEGVPKRRAKIEFLLQRKGYAIDGYAAFIEKDVNNVLDLFSVLNKGTHGRAGQYATQELLVIKKRVEDAVLFIAGIAG